MLYMSALFLYTKDKIIYALKISTILTNDDIINKLKINNKYTNESADPEALINKGDLLLTKECADPVRAQLNKRNAVHNFIDPVFPPSGAPPVGHKVWCAVAHTRAIFCDPFGSCVPLRGWSAVTLPPLRGIPHCRATRV